MQQTKFKLSQNLNSITFAGTDKACCTLSEMRLSADLVPAPWCMRMSKQISAPAKRYIKLNIQTGRHDICSILIFYHSRNTTSNRTYKQYHNIWTTMTLFNCLTDEWWIGHSVLEYCRLSQFTLTTYRYETSSTADFKRNSTQQQPTTGKLLNAKDVTSDLTVIKCCWYYSVIFSRSKQ